MRGRVKERLASFRENVIVDDKAVWEAVSNAAEDIHGENYDYETVKGIINSAKQEGKDTEDVIQIAINMMRSGYNK